MKKVILASLLLSTAISAHATQCPPASAFSYAESDHKWVLENAYKSQWLIQYSSINEAGDKNTLSPLTELNTYLSGRADGSYFSQCIYTHASVRIDVTGGDFTVNPAANPNFHPYHNGIDYKCITSASSTAVCEW